MKEPDEFSGVWLASFDVPPPQYDEFKDDLSRTQRAALKSEARRTTALTNLFNHCDAHHVSSKHPPFGGYLNIQGWPIFDQQEWTHSVHFDPEFKNKYKKGRPL